MDNEYMNTYKINRFDGEAETVKAANVWFSADVAVFNDERGNVVLALNDITRVERVKVGKQSKNSDFF